MAALCKSYFMIILNIYNNRGSLVEAIDGFNEQYHGDYFVVSKASKEYLANLNETNAVKLAKVLRRALLSWGAAKRKAPSVKDVTLIAKTLLSTDLHRLLLSFATNGITKLPSRTAMQFGKGLGTFEESLVDLLNVISEEIFCGNKNVTYPMKALLLLTAFMPALDSQVRRGLAIAGFRGMSATSYPLPGHATLTSAKKITRLPFYLDQCFKNHFETFKAITSETKYPELIDHPGRLFDILFFMQGSEGKCLLRLEQANPKWYELD